MKFTVLLTLLALCTPAFADQAQPGLKQKIVLENGMEVMAELRGDESAHFWRTDDGKLYRMRSGKYVSTSLEEVREISIQNRKRYFNGTTADGALKTRSSVDRSSTVGNKKGLIILVEFKNKKFSMDDPNAYFNRLANEEGFSEGKNRGSLYDYFKAQSDGKFLLNFNIVGPVTMPNDYEYYGADSDYEQDKNVGQMIVNAIGQISSKVNWKELDWNGDNEVEQIYLIYAGEGQSTGGGANTIWPHKSKIEYQTSNGKPYEIDGMKVNTYACSNEIRGRYIAGIGTICHEFSHCLGYADLYDISGNSGNTNTQYGMGRWDLMSSGSHNDDGYCPPNYTAYEKMTAGWITPTVLSTNHYSGRIKSETDQGEAFIAYNDANYNEYLMIDYRDKTGWDEKTAGSGLMIMHVDYDDLIFKAYNSPNTLQSGINDHQRMTIYHADLTASQSDESTDLFPYLSEGSVWRDMLTASSSPSIVAYNQRNGKSSLLDIKISRIRKHDDGTMSFFFGNPVLAGDEFIFAESFDGCAGTGGNDGNWVTLRTATGAFVADNEGWTGDYMKGGSTCARFGSKADNATVTSPEIAFTGDCELYLKYAAFGSTTTAIEISSDNPSVKIEQPTLEVTKQGWWNEATVKITGKGKAKLTFKPNGPMFLDDLLVTDLSSTGLENVTIDTVKEGAKGVYTLSGQRIATDTKSLPKGLYIIDGKKTVIK